MQTETQKSGTWSAEEKALLRELFPDTPMPEMAARLNRTEASVTAKARNLELERSPEYWAALKAKQAANVRANNPSRGRHWTQEELALILANPTLNKGELATHFNTTPGRVSGVVSALRKKGLLPAYQPPTAVKKAPKVRTYIAKTKREKAGKVAGKPVIQVVSRRLPVAKVVEQKEPYNRDLDRKMVRVDARTWKYAAQPAT